MDVAISLLSMGNNHLPSLLAKWTGGGIKSYARSLTIMRPEERPPSGISRILHFISNYVMLWLFFYVTAFIIICLLWAVLEVF